jgi:hypothetical protein
MSGNWQNNIKYVTAGEPVQAGVVTRPDQVLAARTDYLKDRLDAAFVGQALFDSGATISPDVLPGHPVYWNYTSHRYEKALAAAAIDTATQLLTIQPSSDCVGLCLRKHSETLGDIVLRGVVEIPELNNAVTTPTVLPGRYYLSAAEPGKLVQQKPGVTVSVCYVQGPKDNCSDVPRVVVMPHTRDFVGEHTHYRFELFPAPAGQHNPDAAVTTGRHTITNPNPLLPGWLPANHASFNGKAPVGAWFGYNLARHQTLANVWPPLPIQSVAMLWDKGLNKVGATEIPQGKEGLVVCDVNGIWWMSNCYGDVPWPAALDTTTPQTSEPEPIGECPREEDMRVVVVFLRMLYGNDRSVVTSLQPDTDSPITVVNCDGAPAMTGDLALNINLPVLPDESIGGQALKEVVLGHKFKKGWITEGVFTLSNQLAITSTRGTKRSLTTAEKTEFGIDPALNIPLQQGIVKIDYTDTLVEREISPQIIRLNDTVERLYLDIPYLGFPPAQASALRVRLNLPDSNLGNNLRMKIRVQFFGRGGTSTQAATLPALYMTYRRLQKPAALGTPLATTDTAISFNSVVSLRVDTAVTRDSAEFAVAAGDTVLVTLGREYSPSDVYAEVGVLRITGIVYSAT